MSLWQQYQKVVKDWLNTNQLVHCEGHHSQISEVYDAFYLWAKFQKVTPGKQSFRRLMQENQYSYLYVGGEKKKLCYKNCYLTNRKVETIHKLKIQIDSTENKALHAIAGQDLRLPEHVIRWLIREEMKRRGLEELTPCEIESDN